MVGEIEQARDQLVGPQSLLRAFQDATALDAADARTLLAKFGLVADHVTRPADTLSPGERTRASLALLMANGPPTCLVLDEPTNHLDLPAIEQLEEALDAFGGTVLLVTHDRSLLAGSRSPAVSSSATVGSPPTSRSAEQVDRAPSPAPATR